ncbi:MAG: TonB-dependent receptor, partial [Caulobacterales bacterium]|nr:TonB-dependent receptor [Caulobacterales bacterium]
MKRAVLMAATAMLAVTGGPMAASWGQDDAVEEDGGADRIVVTARKREEDLTDVPISLSAFSSTVIENRLIDNINEISDFTPGFQQQQAFGRNGDRPVIRGASNILVAEGKVGFFIDGIPLTGDVSALDLSNLARVEVIKGPQSAVFGRGTLSGAINFVTERPGDEHEYRVEGTIGNFQRYEAIGSWSG